VGWVASLTTRPQCDEDHIPHFIAVSRSGNAWRADVSIVDDSHDYRPDLPIGQAGGIGEGNGSDLQAG